METQSKKGVADGDEDMDTLNDSSSDSEEEEAQEERKQEELWLKVKELRKQVAENSLYYDGHVNLITTLRELFELEEARKAREKMSEVYPLTSELWLEWIRDEQKVCTGGEERQYIIDLFDRAVKDYTSVQLWVEYVMFMLGGGDLVSTRAVGDRALTAVGTHVAEGVLVWQVVLLVEKQVYAGLQKPGAVLSEQETVDLEKQLNRIQSLYKRQMRVPLLNSTSDSLQEEASEYFENEIEPQMKEDLRKSQKRLEEKTPFENDVLQQQNDADKLAAFRRYINATKESDNPAAVQSLYERAVVDHCLDAGLWEEYVAFTMHQFPGLDYVVLPVCERSQRNCPWSATLCEYHITALQMFAIEGEEKSTTAKIKGALEKGLGCGLQYGSEATRMWMAYLIFLRRQIRWGQPHEEQLTFFREAAQQAITMIDKYFGEEGDLESEIPRFLARIEAEFAHNCERTREIWNDVIMKRNNNFNKATLWLEYINLERSYGSEKHCRKLMRRALERVWDRIEDIGLAFLHFEQETGSLQSMEDFKKRYEDRMVIVNNKRAEDAAKLEAEAFPKAKENQRKKQQEKKNKYDKKSDKQKHPHPASKPSQVIKETVKSEMSSKRSNSSTPSVPPGEVAPPPGFNGSITVFKGDENKEVSSSVPPPPGFTGDVSHVPTQQGGVEPPPGFKSNASHAPRGSKRQADNSDESQAKKLKVEKLHGALTKDDPQDEMCTLFLSNLDFNVDKDEIVAFFQGCGEVSDFRLVKDFKCRSKGFGYLVFKTHEATLKGLEMDRSLLNGRPVYVSPYDPENHTHKFKYSTGLEKEKLFIRGLPFTMSESDIKEAFEPHGEIKCIRLVTYRNGHSKGTCYIEYHDASTAEKVQKAMDGTQLDNKTISVLISNPLAKPSSASTASREISLGAGNTQKKVPGARGKGMFSLMPRALMKPPAATPKPTTTDTPTKKMSNDDFRSMLLRK